MKKLLLATLMVAALGSSAFAMDVNKISSKAQTNFEAKFASATNAKWSVRDSYNKVSFTLADENVEAFFATDGELIGVSRKVEFKSLPLSAIQKIKKEYASFKVTDAIEFEQSEEKSYYVSLQDSNRKIVLEVSLYGNVSIFRGTSK